MEVEKHIGKPKVEKSKKITRWHEGGLSNEDVLLKIEEEARIHIAEFQKITESSLRSINNYRLLNAIRRYYPNGMSGLHQKLEVNIDRVPRGFWQQSEAEVYMRTKAYEFYLEYGKLTQELLVKKGQSGLANGFKFYPGGFRQLKADLGIETSKKPNGFWTTTQILGDALNFIGEYGRISPNLLSQNKRDDLRVAITKQYPGGWIQLRADLNQDSQRTPAGYWNEERIRQKATDVLKKHGRISRSLLEELGEKQLANSLGRYYPGGWRQLRTDLGLAQPHRDKWEIEEIKKEYISILDKNSNITFGWLVENGYSSLAVAIRRRYPGSYKQIRIDCGVTELRKEHGFWTLERIEMEALNFLHKFGELNHNLLRRKGYRNLSSIISSKYPGRINALRLKLGIPSKEINETISLIQANNDLERLVE